MKINYQKILDEIHREVLSLENEGHIATYIPELAHVDPEKFGMGIHCLNGAVFSIGDADEKFSTQSISKVFALGMAMGLKGEAIWERLHVEPSGDPYNSLVQLEYEKGIPRNPMINAGALVITDILLEELNDPMADFLAFVRNLANNAAIDYNLEVAASELRTGYKNAALANLLKSFGNLRHPVEEVLDFYSHVCAIEMSCNELAQAFNFLAAGGTTNRHQKVTLTSLRTKRINAIMQTCGFYDEAGEFSFRVGLPGKSGVGGGIAAVHPRHYAVAVWSPRLNPKGNSYRGMKALELLTSKTKLSIF